MKHRQTTRLLVPDWIKKNIAEDKCAICGKPKSKWNRRKDWRCCSTTCTEKYHEKVIYENWAFLRVKALERDHYTCVKCGDDRREIERFVKHKTYDPEYYMRTHKIKMKTIQVKKKVPNFTVDHILPIALGGDEFDLKNLQTLCYKCNKIKTSNDLKLIALQRKREKAASRELNKYIKRGNQV